MDVLSILNYLQVRFYIFFLKSIAPISILYCILLVAFPTLLQPFRTQLLFLAIECWLVAEAISYHLFYLPLKYYLHRPAIHPDPLPREERKKLFKRCLSTVTDPEKYLSQWFRGASKADIRQENVREFIRWAFFNAKEVADDEEEEVENYLQETEKLLGREIPPGRGKAKSLRVTLDSVGCSYRSLFWYFCVTVVDTITFWSMLYNGFQFHRTSACQLFTLFPFRPLALFSTKRSPAKHLTYWHREHLSRTRLPVLFIHGIGVGLYPYTNFLRDINETGRDGAGVGVIAIEIMTISSRITYQAFDTDLIVNEIRAILKHHSWRKYILIGHSYGTGICTHLLRSQQTSSLVGPVVLIDPICFLLHLPDVAYNFTVRQPMHTKELVLWYFGSKDIRVAHTLARRFFWHENILWKEDLEVDGRQSLEVRNVTVVLSGKDDIIDAKAVKWYLTASLAGSVVNDETTRKIRLEVIWFEHFHHGEVFDFKEARKAVIGAIRACSNQGKGNIS